MLCRTPHGVRGLKPMYCLVAMMIGASHPSRGAWIETTASNRQPKPTASRTPHGVRGLKPQLEAEDKKSLQSHPSRGAWIET